MRHPSRRAFLRALAGSAGGAALGVPLLGAATGCGPAASGAPQLAGTSSLTPPAQPGARLAGARRSVVVTPGDLTLDWPGWASAMGLDTIALHSVYPLQELAPFVASAAGQAFLDRCAALGIDVEYEVHAMVDLLPRSLFASRPELFRADASCQRVSDNNLCVHQPDALAIAADNAVAIARRLRPTTHRYFLWPDDGANWCQCPCCAPLSFSDQQLVLENALLAALRSEDSQATLAHLAYSTSLVAPVEVRPAPGIFLEFAPIFRRYDMPFDTPADPTQRAYLDALDANLAWFGSANAKALEYWLDVSRFSGWQPPARALPFDESLVAADLAYYRSRGVVDVATFAAWLDASYVTSHGNDVLLRYAADLAAR